MLKRCFSFFTVLLFFIWILPLGVFIKPSQEKQACDGQRAICLCSHLLAKQAAKAAGKILLKNGASSSTQKESSGGVSHDFLVMNDRRDPILQAYPYKVTSNLSLQSAFISLLEAVPKV